MVKRTDLATAEATYDRPTLSEYFLVLAPPLVTGWLVRCTSVMEPYDTESDTSASLLTSLNIYVDSLYFYRAILTQQ